MTFKSQDGSSCLPEPSSFPDDLVPRPGWKLLESHLPSRSRLARPGPQGGGADKAPSLAPEEEGLGGPMKKMGQVPND